MSPDARKAVLALIFLTMLLLMVTRSMIGAEAIQVDHPGATRNILGAVILSLFGFLYMLRNKTLEESGSASDDDTEL